MLSQARAFTRQVPLLYAAVAVNTAMLVVTQENAPNLLRFYLPGLLLTFCVWRAFYWWNRRDADITDQQAERLIKNTVWISGALSATSAIWALSLYGYGTALQQAHVAFYIVITGICSIFCLSYLRVAAVINMVGTMVPFVAFFAFSGQPIFVALSINFVVVLITLFGVVLANSRDFAALVASRSTLVAGQSQTLALSNENHRLANIDSLTDLPNRRYFDRELAARLHLAEQAGTSVIVARLDLDSFKSVNDIFGQTIGDRVLQEVAVRARTVTRHDTFIARIAGDQFGLISTATAAPQRDDCGNRLATAMQQPFGFEDATLHLSASVGLAISRAGDTPATLFDRADYVASLAKREARGKALMFTDHHAAEISRVRTMEHALRTADLDAELYILFQPQFDIALSAVTGYEVLARWASPVLGEVPPVIFIPMAERLGLIPKITQTVLRKALTVIDRLPLSQRLSVNLSAHDISSVIAIEAIAAMVESAGTPSRVDFEITETAVMGDLVQANTSLLSLLALGSRIALDDFGTGHSSLTHVQKLPLDRIKIDRSFVAEVTSDPTSRAIVKTSIDLCRNLGISCVFEGIETEEQLDVLMGLGGTVMQGYLFGRPMSEANMLEHAQKAHPAWGAARNQLYGAAR